MKWIHWSVQFEESCQMYMPIASIRLIMLQSIISLLKVSLGIPFPITLTPVPGDQ